MTLQFQKCKVFKYSKKLILSQPDCLGKFLMHKNDFPVCLSGCNILNQGSTIWRRLYAAAKSLKKDQALSNICLRF